MSIFPSCCLSRFRSKKMVTWMNIYVKSFPVNGCAENSPWNWPRQTAARKSVIYCGSLAEGLRNNRYFTDKTSSLSCSLRRCRFLNSSRLQNRELYSITTPGNTGQVPLIRKSVDLGIRPSPGCSWYCHSGTYCSCILRTWMLLVRT